ncbi:MAG: response regulator [Gammaproteobacteria bacterium]|nr:response regulator [Gammaproteobacteria bacterium]
MSHKEINEASLLIVDDEPSNVAFLREVMEVAGCKHIFATTSATEALAQYESEAFDLVLLDLNMPEMSGFQMLQRFNELNKANAPKVLVLTGHNDAEIKKEAMALGASGMLSKPFGMAEIISTIEHYLA